MLNIGGISLIAQKQSRKLQLPQLKVMDFGPQDDKGDLRVLTLHLINFAGVKCTKNCEDVRLNNCYGRLKNEECNLSDNEK